MYCAACDRWEDDQIALDCEVCLRCGGDLCQPDDDQEEESMTHTTKRIEILKLLHKLRQDDEKPGEIILRALRLLDSAHTPADGGGK